MIALALLGGFWGWVVWFGFLFFFFCFPSLIKLSLSGSTNILTSVLQVRTWGE